MKARKRKHDVGHHFKCLHECEPNLDPMPIKLESEFLKNKFLSRRGEISISYGLIIIFNKRGLELFTILSPI